MKARRGLTLLSIVLLGLSSVASAADPPGLINHQGVLRDSLGNPVDNPMVDMVFRFYDSGGGATCVGGTLLLTDGHLAAGAGAVPVTGGLFNVHLGGGAITPGTVSTLPEVFRDNTAVYMEVDVDDGGGAETLCPRIRVVSAGYALNADHLDGKSSSDFLDTSSTAQTKTGNLAVQDLTVNGLQFFAGGPFIFGSSGSFTLRAGDSDTDFLELGAGNSLDDGRIIAFGDDRIEIMPGNGTVLLKDGSSPGFPTFAIMSPDQLIYSADATFQGTLIAESLNSSGSLFLSDQAALLATSTDLTVRAGGSSSDDLFLHAGGVSLNNGHIKMFGDGEIDIWAGNGEYAFHDDTGFESLTLDANGDVTTLGSLTLGNFDTFVDLDFSTFGQISVRELDFQITAGNVSTDDLLLFAGNDLGEDGALEIFGGGTFRVRSGNGRFTFLNAATGTEMARLENGTLDFDGDLEIGGDITCCGNIHFDIGDFRDVIFGNGVTTVPDVDVAIAAGGLCVDDDGSCTPPVDGHIKAVVYDTGNSDVAEVYPSDETLAAGDVVVFGGNVNGRIRRSNRPYETGFISVVSTQPGMVLGSPTEEELRAAGFGSEPKPNFGKLAMLPQEYPVVLMGRAPVRVSDQNGPIRRGDPLTSSSIPGVAMKATRPGPLLGQALEPWAESGQGRIEVLVMPQWQPEGDAVAPTDIGEEPAVTAPPMVEIAARTENDSDEPARVQERDDLSAEPERVDTVPVSLPAEPGDVLVADLEHPGSMRPSFREADPAVVGIVTGEPGLDFVGEPVKRVPVAFTGIILCKVDAGYGSVWVGDLLTTSATPGHARRAVHPGPGTVLGKALEPLEAGTGMIRVLVMLR